jgi:hypothetical protein
MTATWFARLCSPNVAYLVVDSTAGKIQLFHHFQHNIIDGLNDETNQLWTLQEGSSMTQAVSIQPYQLSLMQKSFAIQWTTMTVWNSTDNMLAEVKRRVKAHASKAARASWYPLSGRSAKALALIAKKKGRPWRRQQRKKAVHVFKRAQTTGRADGSRI